MSSYCTFRDIWIKLYTVYTLRKLFLSIDSNWQSNIYCWNTKVWNNIPQLVFVIWQTVQVELSLNNLKSVFLIGVWWVAGSLLQYFYASTSDNTYLIKLFNFIVKGLPWCGSSWKTVHLDQWLTFVKTQGTKGVFRQTVCNYSTEINSFWQKLHITSNYSQIRHPN